MNKAEDIVSKFYNTVGWKTDDEIAEDTRLFEDLREYSKDYVSKCRLRVLRHIPESGVNMLDMASGPIPYPEYIAYSRNFKKRYCVDLSSEALEMAKKKIGDHGVFLRGSFFDLPLEENFFDCAISLHTIYHMDKDRQEEAVRKLIHVTKPEKPVIILYSNPNASLAKLSYRFGTLPFRALRKIKRMMNKSEMKIKQDDSMALYFYSHPNEWWNRFTDVANVKVLPWRSFSSDTQKKLIPNNKLGKKMFDVLFRLEERYPDFFAKHFQYPMIVLTKKKT